LVRAGETGGVLEESLLRVADQLEKEDAPRRQIKSAMVYPAVVLSFAPLVLLGLVTFIVPVFVGVFEQFGGDLPAMTKVTVGLSNAIKGYWWAFIAGVAGAVWLFRRWKRSARGRGQWDTFRLRIPMKIGDIVQKVALARPSGRSRSRAGRARWRPCRRRRPAAAGPRHHRPDGRQPRGRERNGGRHRVGQARRHDRRAAQAGRRLPEHGHPHGRRRGRDRRTRRHGLQDRGLLRGPGRRRRQGPDLDPRAVMLVVVGAIVGFIVISMYLPLFKVYDQIR
jgi:type IV pilus assembly protein PilC